MTVARLPELLKKLLKQTTGNPQEETTTLEAIRGSPHTQVASTDVALDLPADLRKTDNNARKRHHAALHPTLAQHNWRLNSGMMRDPRLGDLNRRPSIALASSDDEDTRYVPIPRGHYQRLPAPAPEQENSARREEYKRTRKEVTGEERSAAETDGGSKVEESDGPSADADRAEVDSSEGPIAEGATRARAEKYLPLRHPPGQEEDLPPWAHGGGPGSDYSTASRVER